MNQFVGRNVQGPALLTDTEKNLISDLFHMAFMLPGKLNDGSRDILTI